MWDLFLGFNLGKYVETFLYHSSKVIFAHFFVHHLLNGVYEERGKVIASNWIVQEYVCENSSNLYQGFRLLILLNCKVDKEVI